MRFIGAFVELNIFKQISRTNLGHYIRNATLFSGCDKMCFCNFWCLRAALRHSFLGMT